jgi:uncharacterized membrane protein HdeD (DUF308 family)
MDDLLSRNWWAVVLRGFLALGFGFLALARPGLTLAFLLILFGVYALDDGIFALISAVRAGERNERWGMIAAEGVLGILVGIFTFLAPAATAVGLFIVIAVWAIATGALELVAAMRLRRQVQGEWLLVLAGFLRIAFGVLLVARPSAGLNAMLWVMAFYALFYGLVLIGLGFKLKRFQGVFPPGRAPTVTPQPA